MAEKTSTNRSDIGFILESVKGTTPATPAFQLLPTTGGAPDGGITTEVSEVIDSTRQLTDLIQTDSEVAGDINFELTYDPWRWALISLMRGTSYSVSIAAATDIGVNGSSQFTSTTTDFVAEGIQVGQWVRTAGFTEAVNNGYHLVTAVAANLLTVDANYSSLTVEASGDSINVDGYMVRNGTGAGSSYTMVKRIQGIDTEGYFYYRGVELNQLVLNLDATSKVTAVLSTMGLTEDPTETAISGQTFVAAQNHKVMSAAVNVNASVLRSSGGVVATFNKMDLTLNNNLLGAKELGVLGNSELEAMTFEVTASVDIYFEDVDQYLLFKNGTEFHVHQILVDGDGNGVVVTMPYCKFEELTPPRDGKDQYLMLSGTFRALKDPTLGYTAQFDLIDKP